MQVKVENLEGLERKVSIQLPWDEYEQKSNDRIKELKKTVKIDGFRPGKAPESMIRQKLGEAIEGEILNDMIRQSLPQALEQEDLNPAGMPMIDPQPIEKGQPIEFSVKFEVMPEIAIKDLKDITINKLKGSIGDEDINEALEGLRKQKVEWKETEKASADGDQMIIDFDGSVDGVAFDGGKSEDFSIVLGEGRMIPGFEDGLVGLKAGAEHDLNVTFPEEYHAKDLAGKAAVFKITVKQVSNPELPELNDEFVKLWGIEEGGLDKLKEEIKTGLERELNQSLNNKLREEVFDKLLENNQFDIPNALIDQEIERMQKANQQEMQMRYGIKNAGLMPKELFEESARRGVALSLIMAQVIKEHDLKADGDKVKEIIEAQCSAYENPEQMAQYYYQNDQLLRSIEAQALEEQVVEKMLETAIVEEQETSYSELKQQAQNKEA